MSIISSWYKLKLVLYRLLLIRNSLIHLKKKNTEGDLRAMDLKCSRAGGTKFPRKQDSDKELSQSSLEIAYLFITTMILLSALIQDLSTNRYSRLDMGNCIHTHAKTLVTLTLANPNPLVRNLQMFFKLETAKCYINNPSRVWCPTFRFH